MKIKATGNEIRLHLTNVTGAGAVQLVGSLLPALLSNPKVTIKTIYLPDRGNLSNQIDSSSGSAYQIYERILPNSISRFLECTFFGHYFNGDTPMIVFGDLPIQCSSPQILFLQNSLILKPLSFFLRRLSFKYIISQLIFHFGIRNVDAFIVQTKIMRDQLVKRYPRIKEKVFVVGNPVPTWLINNNSAKFKGRSSNLGKLKLFYPAASYKHKNHELLSKLDPEMDLPVSKLVLTIDPKDNPAPFLVWLVCEGFMEPKNIIKTYSDVDAVLFMSLEESYGFPLLEAMYLGLPIVCSDLPYARNLCGNEAIYFDPTNPNSLIEALHTLDSQLQTGWVPNWKESISNVPANWDEVSKSFLEISSSVLNK